MRRIMILLCLLTLPAAALAQELFVGLESAGLVTRSTDLGGFPTVTYTDRFVFEVSGAAATPDDYLYLCNGPFTTRLYGCDLSGPPQLLSTIDLDMSALAYGENTLWGYSNYATPKGIYAIDPATGATTLVLDVYTGTGYRFFALDYNPNDGLLYGYTEYGTSGLYSINIDSGEMTHLAGTIPASNGQGRGMAVGNNTVYLTATRGDDQIPHFAYDLSQGAGGTWVGFTNPYPNHHSTGGSAWLPGPPAGIGQEVGTMPGTVVLQQNYPNPFNPLTTIRFVLPTADQVSLRIYATSGRQVATLLDQAQLGAGPHQINWRGNDDAGHQLAASVYFYRLETGAHHEQRRMVLVK